MFDRLRVLVLGKSDGNAPFSIFRFMTKKISNCIPPSPDELNPWSSTIPESKGSDGLWGPKIARVGFAGINF